MPEAILRLKLLRLFFSTCQKTGRRWVPCDAGLQTLMMKNANAGEIKRRFRRRSRDGFWGGERRGPFRRRANVRFLVWRDKTTISPEVKRRALDGERKGRFRRRASARFLGGEIKRRFWRRSRDGLLDGEMKGQWETYGIFGRPGSVKKVSTPVQLFVDRFSFSSLRGSLWRPPFGWGGPGSAVGDPGSVLIDPCSDLGDKTPISPEVKRRALDGERKSRFRRRASARFLGGEIKRRFWRRSRDGLLDGEMKGQWETYGIFGRPGSVKKVSTPVQLFVDRFSFSSLRGSLWRPPFGWGGPGSAVGDPGSVLIDPCSDLGARNWDDATPLAARQNSRIRTRVQSFGYAGGRLYTPGRLS